MLKWITSIALISSFFLLSCRAQEPDLNYIKLPSGFHITYYAKGIKDARSLTQGAKGTVFVGNRSGDKVYALVDSNKDFKVDQVITIAEGLNMPNGVVFHKGDLYLAEVDKIWKYPGIEAKLNDPPKPILIFDKLPTDRHHGWKYIDIGPDNKLYIPIGAPCNVCEKENPVYSTICRMNLDGSGFEVYAQGVRNSVGFDWHPISKELWFTDNGRDMMGDDIPNDELNYAPTKGMHFGFPYCHQGDILDLEFGKGKKCDDYVYPAKKLGPHVASLGAMFYTGKQFPASYMNKLFIAKHGSWNRSSKIGYEITVLSLGKDFDRVESEKVFASGWLQKGDKVLGRPVAFLQLDDGSLLVSDDFSDCIYRIYYEE